MRRRLLRYLIRALWGAGCVTVYLWLGYRFDWPTWFLAFFAIALGDGIMEAAE